MSRLAGAQNLQEIPRDRRVLNLGVIRSQIPGGIFHQILERQRCERMSVVIRGDEPIRTTQSEKHIRRACGEIKMRAQFLRACAGIRLQPREQVQLPYGCRQ